MISYIIFTYSLHPGAYVPVIHSGINKIALYFVCDTTVSVLRVIKHA